MSGLKQTFFGELKQVLWALFLVYLILLGVYLFIKKTGYEHSLLVTLSIAIFVTITFIAVYLFNIVCIAVERRVEKYLNRSKKNP